MTTRAKRWLYWSPRLLGILFAAAMCLIALQPFWSGRALRRAIDLFLVEIIPGAVLALVLALSWRWPWVGGAAFTVLGVLYLAGNTWLFPSPLYFVVGGTPLLLGLLFALNWRYRRELAT